MMTNCPNCGAPLKRSMCEYCGTESPKRMTSEMQMTASSISLRCYEQDDVRYVPPDWFDARYPGITFEVR